MACAWPEFPSVVRASKGLRLAQAAPMDDITGTLSRVELGDPNTDSRTLPLVYDELRKLAVAKWTAEKPGQTLQPTALVHEAYFRLVGKDQAQHWDSRHHFFAAAAEAMRRILIERARQKNSLKEGANRHRVPLDSVEPAVLPLAYDDLLGLEETLQKLEQKYPRKAELIKLRFFAGLSMDQAPKVLGVSTSSS